MKTKWVAIVLAAASLMSFSGCGNEEVNSDSSSQIESSEDEKEDLSEDVIDKKAHVDCASFLVSDDWSYREVEENNSTQKLFYWNKTDDNYFYIEEQEFLDSYTGDLNDTKEYLHWLYNGHVDQGDAVIVEECEDTTISGLDAVKFKYTKIKEREGRDKTALMYITVYDNKAYYFVFVDRGDSDYKISDYGEEVVKSIVLSGGKSTQVEKSTDAEKMDLDKTAELLDGITFSVSSSWDFTASDSGHGGYYYHGEDEFLYVQCTDAPEIYEYGAELLITGIYNGMVKGEGVQSYSEANNITIADNPAISFTETIKGNNGNTNTSKIYTTAFNGKSYVFAFTEPEGTTNGITTVADDVIASIAISNTNNTESEQPNQSTWETLSYSGAGDQVLTDVPLPSETMIMHATYNGDGNFIVHYHDCNDNEEYIVNEIGSYEGYQAFENTYSDDSSAGMLEVTGSGNWTIEFIPLETFLQQASSIDFSGTGDGVTWWFNGDGKNHVVNLSHDGQHNFIAKLYSMDGDREEYIVNEIGSYNGQTVVHTEAGQRYFISVTADGNWSISFQ